MIRIYTFLTALLLGLTINAQSPDKFNYQAVIRNADGGIRANQDVNIQIGILQGSVSGTSIYIESHAKSTTTLGLVNLVIGDGKVISGTLAGIDWSIGPFYLKIWVDSVEMGTSQLISVPYAKYAEKAGNGFSGNYTDLSNKPQKIGDFQGDMKNSRISNISNPSDDQDAVTKSYLLSILSETGLLNSHFDGFVKDTEGKSYPVIKVGSQVWMAKNLSTSHYQNGDNITLANNASTWTSLVTGGYCYYNSDTNNIDFYGKLYNFLAITDSRNVCPSGWRLPTIEDWVSLRTFLGGVGAAGEKMKEPGVWQFCSLMTTNSSGFTGVPGGCCSYTGVFGSLGDYGLWWSSTSIDSDNAWYINLYSQGSEMQAISGNKKYGFSVRCIKD